MAESGISVQSDFFARYFLIFEVEITFSSNEALINEMLRKSGRILLPRRRKMRTSPGGPQRMPEKSFSLNHHIAVGILQPECRKKIPQGDDQVSERRLLESLKRTLKKIGLKGHLHTFRHSFISQAIIKGIAETIIHNWVGHVDDKTLQHYTHIAARESRAAREKMNNDESA